MALGLLCLGLTLLGALWTQAQDDTTSALNTGPNLNEVPLHADFKEDQFQGKWYVVSVAENTVRDGRQRQLKMYSVTYELKDDHSYNVTTTLIRNEVCDHWMRTVVPSDQPGQFTLGDMESYVGVQSYIMRVAATNYNEFAMVFFQKVFNNKVYFKTTLYGRTKELSPELKERFIKLAKSLGLSDDNIIFPVPIEECI